MNNFFTLLKVQTLGLFGINKRLNKKSGSGKSAITGMLSLLLIAACIVYMGYVYSDRFADYFAAVNELYKTIPMMMAIASVISFVYSFYSTGTVLYGFKDYQLLSSMPVKNREIVLSKLAYMYISDLAFDLMVMIPSVYVYGTYGGEINAAFIFTVIILILFSPLMMIALSVAVGALTTYISTFFRKKYIAQTIMFALLTVGLLVFSFLSGYDSALSGTMFAAITKIYFPYSVAEAAMGSVCYLLLFAAINAGAFAAVAVAVCYTYKKMNTLVFSRRTLKNFKLKNSNEKSQFSALLSREAKRLFTCPLYVINSLIGMFMSVAFGLLYMILMVIFSKNGLALSVTENFMIFVPAAFSFVFFMAPTTESSLSLEGKTFWIIRTMPVDMKSVFNAKLILSYIIYGIFGVLTSLVITVPLGYSAVIVLLVTFNALVSALLASNLGLLVNILLPKLEWENENQVIKRSATTFVMTLVAFVLTGLFAFTGAEALENGFATVFFLLIAAFFELICAFIIYIIIMEKGEKMLFKKI